MAGTASANLADATCAAFRGPARQSATTRTTPVHARRRPTAHTLRPLATPAQVRTPSPSAVFRSAVPVCELAGDETLVLPRDVVTMLAYMLAQLAEGRGVTAMPSHAELTTRQAADLLNVSRPYLIGLLEAGAIPFRLVGRHRRVRFEDLMTYKQRIDAESRRAADDLIALSEELGLYE